MIINESVIISDAVIIDIKQEKEYYNKNSDGKKIIIKMRDKVRSKECAKTPSTFHFLCVAPGAA